MSEIELKFGVPEEAVATIERTLRRRGGRARTIASHYWDSADRRLAKAGVSLRLRKSAVVGSRPSRRPAQARPSGSKRPCPARVAGTRKGRPDLGLHAGTPAESILRAALAQRDGGMPALVPVFASVIKRLALDIDVAKARIEIAFDRGAIQAGDRSLPLCEVEAELKQGDIAALIEVARAGIDAHGLWLSTSSKAARGDWLVAPDGPRAVKARPARWPRERAEPRSSAP